MILSTLLLLICTPPAIKLHLDRPENPHQDAAQPDVPTPEGVTRGTFLSPHGSFIVRIYLIGGDPTVVQVLGSGATDVDADLLDETGTVVQRERSTEDRAWFEVLVPEDRTYRLRVRNLGDWTNDVLVTLR